MTNTYTTMMGNVITANETGTHCYMWPNGRKGERIRIKKAEYEQIIREDKLERKLASEAPVEIEITELEPREGEKVYHDEPIGHTDIEAAVEATEESQTTEETQQIAKEFAPVELEPAVINEFGCVDCRNCPVDGCVHRDCMRRNPTSVGGLGECPRLKVKKQESAPKKKSARRSKDIAYDGNGVTLTAKQVDFIRHLPDTNFWENGLDSAVWTDVLADEIGGQFAGKPMTTGAMISTICEKGLAVRATDRINGRKATFMALTELGKKVAAELGLN